MAQRTGDKRLLTPSAKSASAGVALALALAVLLLAGCGGGSSSDTSESTSSSASATATPAQKGSAAKADAAPANAATGKGAGAGAAGAPGKTSTASVGGGSGGAGKKHGPHVAQPKGAPEQAPSQAEVSSATVADIALSSPSLAPGSGEAPPLTAAYTCDGRDEWPALSWSGVPAGSAELILYAMNIQPVEGKLFVDWAVAGIDPALTGIEAGRLPKGGVVGTNSYGKQGYEICPPAGSGETYLFALYALPRALSPRPGFDARELRRQILEVSGNVGLYPVAYSRG